jgi:hypothetical protein
VAVLTGNLSSDVLDQEAALELEFSATLADRGPGGRPDQGGFLRRVTMEALEIRRNTIGISCFAQDSITNYLWGQYADSHLGICLGIETDHDKRCFQQLEEVHYEDPLPKFKVLSHMGRNLRRLYTTKETQWAAEREIRAFQHTCGPWKMNPECLVEVYFGIRAEPRTVEEVTDIVRLAYGSQVRLFRTTRVEGNKLGFESLND